MIELRWKQRGLRSATRNPGAADGVTDAEPNMVLEYRTQLNIFEPVSPPLWSKWIEVPVEFEQENEHEH